MSKPSPTPCLLAIDTLSLHLSVSLYYQGQTHSITEPTQKHANAITETIGRLLEQAQCERHDIDYLVVNNGPGSFTSLRVGLSSTQALAHALNIPVFMITNSRLMAYTAVQQYPSLPTPTLLVTLDDAKLSQVYYATYFFDGTTLEQVQAECLFDYAHVPIPETTHDLYACGPCWQPLHHDLPPSWQKKLMLQTNHRAPIATQSRSELLIQMALNQAYSGIDQPVPAGDCQPNYVRHRVAEIPKNKKA